ncbi:hypothetical protein AcW2_005061 [Taiwanofungus camphoratus]|nr:hypothetical protein AcW2_005061 [Antrodia cinnamomea]
MAGTVTRHMPVIDISVWALEIQRTDPFSSLVVYGFRLRPSSLSSSPSSSPPTPPCILPSAQPCRPKDTAWSTSLPSPARFMSFPPAQPPYRSFFLQQISRPLPASPNPPTSSASIPPAFRRL